MRVRAEGGGGVGGAEGSVPLAAWGLGGRSGCGIGGAGGTYSKMRDGFQLEGSTMDTELGMACCWGMRWPDDIMARDCTAGESLLVGPSPPPDIGGVMGWLE